MPLNESVLVKHTVSIKSLINNYVLVWKSVWIKNLILMIKLITITIYYVKIKF